MDTPPTREELQQIFKNLTFSIFEDPKLYQKAYCVNPSKDVCPFGVPCPNTDVTGIGQQISIYITTIIYAFVLAYIPWLQRPMLYAHLSVLYSLLIAALVSILKDELALSDGIFVIVTVASPASIYLWYYSIKSFWDAEQFPIEHANKNKSANKSFEVQATRFFSILSLVFTLVMICLVFIPNIKGIEFPEPACNKAYGTSALWYNVAWQLPVIIQTLVIILFYGIARGLSILWTRRAGYELPPPLFPLPRELELPGFEEKPPSSPSFRIRESVDLITWTEKVLFEQYPHFMNRTLFVCIVTLLQLSALPPLVEFVDSKDCFVTLFLTYGLFRERPSPAANAPKIWAIRVALWIFFAGVWFIRWPMFLGMGLVPNSIDWIFLWLSCSAAKWSWNNFTHSNMKTFLAVLNTVFAFVLVAANIFIILIGDPKSFDTGTFVAPDGNLFSYFSFSVITIGLWIISWLSTSTWPYKRSLSWDKLNKGLWKRAHLLRLCWLVIGPHILWIQASNNSNTSRPMDMTFGQIFAIIVSGVTVVTLLDEAKDVKKDIWLSVLKSDVMYYEEVEQPKHYAPRPGLGMS